MIVRPPLRRVLCLIRAFLILAPGLSLPAGAGATGATATLHRSFSFSPSDVTIGKDARGYTSFAIRGAVPWGDTGGPEFPAVGAWVDLPPGMRARTVQASATAFVRVIESGRLRPRQPDLPSSQDARWVDADPLRYSTSAWIPQSPASLGPSGSMRGRDLAGLVLHPLQIVPSTGEARLATRIDVTIELEATPDPLLRRRIVPEWEDVVDRGFEAALAEEPMATRQALQPDHRWAQQAQATSFPSPASSRLPQPFAPTALPSIQGSPVQYLILTNEALRPAFETLADWKTRQGVPAVVRTVEFLNQNYPFGVDLTDRLRLFIRDAYTQWGTLWVLLGGDIPVIPARYGHTTFFGGADIVTDLYYSDLDGNWDADGDSAFGEGSLQSGQPDPDGLNLLPDVYVGRAPVENLSEAQGFVTKVMQYRDNPPANFVCRGLFLAEVLSPQNWHPGDPVSSDGANIAQQAIQRVSGCMTPVRLYENYTVYPGSLPITKQETIDSLDSGFNLLHHVGHGFRNSMSVGDAALNNPDVEDLQNAPRNSGLLYSINCTSAAIDFESIGEAFLLNTNGGSVSNVGSTNLDFPATGTGYQNDFYNLVFQSGIRRLGQAQAVAKIPYAFFAANDNVQRWTQMSLIYLGDPEMELWTAEPETLAVSFPSAMTLEDTSVTMSVQKDGSPLAGARVCLRKVGEDYRVGTTNGSGQVTLSFRPLTVGSAQLAVVSGNALTYRDTIAVGAASGAALVAGAGASTVDDAGPGTDGNGDGILDAGETVDVTLRMKNVGAATADSVTATLASLDGRASVLVASSSYGAIAPADSAAGTPYRIHVLRPGVRDGDEIHLRLTADDGTGRLWTAEIYLPVRAASVRLAARLLDDGGTGNGDQHLDVGETAAYRLTLLNVGGGVSRDVSATLAPASSGVTVLEGTASFGSIGSQAQASGEGFQVRNDSSAAPRFQLTVSDAYGTVLTRFLDLDAPLAPQGLEAKGSVSSLHLTWAKAQASDLEGYHVYRSSLATGPFTRVTLLPTGRIASYQDGGLPPLTRYYYYVTAADSSANESPPSLITSGSTNPANLPGFPIPMGRNTPSSPVIADLDNDGTLEIVAGADKIFAWHTDGTGVRDADGSERTSGDFTMLGSYYASAPAISDLDGDGVMDIVALSWDTKQLFVFEPDGSVKAGFPAALQDAVWSSPAIGDIDGDGKKEIVFNSNGARIYAFHANGTEVRDGDNDASTIGVFAVAGASFNYGSPALADLDHDGKLDIVSALRDGLIYAWHADGTNLPGFPYVASAGFVTSPAVGDIDADSKLEIAAVALDNKLHVVQEDGSVQPGFPVSGVVGSGNTRTPCPALVDMAGDGQHEILTAGTDGVIRIIRSDGTPYPGWSGVRYSPKTFGVTESSPVAADLDGNGTLEILIGSEEGILYGLGSDGQPFPGFPIQLDGEVRGTPLVYDVDLDGDAEIVLSGWDKNLYVWTYPGVFHSNPLRSWLMFNHDPERTSRLEEPFVVAVEPLPPSLEIPSRVLLAPAYPNPSGRLQTIAYGIPSSLGTGARAHLDLYDVRGAHVRRLFAGPAIAGSHTAVWDGTSDSGRRVTAGVYLARLVVGRTSLVERLVRVGP